MIADLRLAARNLLRNRRRSVATFAALALGCAAILLFAGYRANIELSLQTAYVREGGHLQVQHRDYFLYGSGNPIAYGIAGAQAIAEAARTDDRLDSLVRVVSPMLLFGGIASQPDADVSRTVMILGQDAEAVKRMRAWNQYGLPLPAHAFALVDAGADAAIVGLGLARVLRLCAALEVADCPQPAADDPAPGAAPGLPADIAALVGQAAAAVAPAAGGRPRLDLLASGSAGAPNVVSLEVVLAERQGFKEVDEILLQMQLPMAQRLVFGRDEPKVTSLAFQLHRSDQIEPARRQLAALIERAGGDQPLVVRDYRELNPFFDQTVQMFGMIFGFIFALMAVIVLFTVGNTMSTAVMERTVEIGTLRALGLRQRGIQRLFVFEGALIGVFGSACGAAVALLLAAAVNGLGLTWLPPGSGTRLPLQLIVWGQTGTLLTTTIGLSLIAVASAWWPAHRASRLSIVDALRHA